ncbi:NAD(P)-dependent oxidoreductase [bacterium]|nr:NAD(P)-dependent oxidoreductase [bacterium]
MKQNMLICGATGFLGRNILEHYSKTNQYNIRAVHFKRQPILEYENVEWIYCDLRNADDVKKAIEGIDIVLQFAATTSGAKDILSKPYIHVTDNAVMNSLLLRESFEQGVKHFIFPSCTIMYQSSEDLIKEDDFNPSDEMKSTYFGAGHTKVYLEKMCEFYAGLGKTKYTAIRHSNIYGPHDKYDLERSHVFGATVTKVMSAKDKITVWGTGEEARDLLYVSDLTDFVHKAIEHQKNQYELFNCGAGNAVRIKDLVLKMVEKSGKKLSIDHDLSQPSIPTSLFLDCSKAKKILGWSPAIQLEEGIERTLKWYRSNFNG